MLVLMLLLVGAMLANTGCMTPPDVPVCSPNEPVEYTELQRTFLKLCGEDLTCVADVPAWENRFKTWAAPSDSGHCVYTVSGKTFDIEVGQTFGKKKKTWPQLAESALTVPAEESWAPMKTFVQTACKKSGKCKNGVGNWESTVKTVDKMTGKKK